MQLDKDHKFNFFKKESKKTKDFNVMFTVGMISAIVFSVFLVYPSAKKLDNVAQVLTPQGAFKAGMLTAQSTSVNTMAPTFVVHPQTDSLGMIPPDSFQSMSQKEKLTYWAQNTDPSIQLKPDEIQKIVKIMQKTEVKK